jgi:very-short-patch-repair endonuclease
MPEAFNNRKHLKDYRRANRNGATRAESELWHGLRGKRASGYKFRRQHSLGPFIVDFYCPKLRVVIEIDGFQHYFKDAGEYDKERTAKLENIGFSVLRFDNEDVNIRMDYVIRVIQEFCENRASELKLTDCDFSLH